MELSQIFLAILSTISYIAVASFAISAWFNIRNLQREISIMLGTQRATLALIQAMMLQNEGSQIIGMKRKIQDLVEHEQFEQAQHMSKIVEEREKQFLQSVKSYNENFSDFGKMDVTKLVP